MCRNFSLHAWTLLSGELHASAFQDASDSDSLQTQKQTKIMLSMGLYRYCQEIANPTYELVVYTQPLTATDALVHLCIDNITHFKAQELLSLAQLPSLAVLELIDRDPTGEAISDRIIRGWSETGPVVFPQLRVLRISSRAQEVSEASLQYVLRLPKLEIFDVTARPLVKWRNAEANAAEYGWKTSTPTDSWFVSYAEAYLDGRVPVNVTQIGSLGPLFEEDWQSITVSVGSRDKEGMGGETDSQVHLDRSWRTILQGTYDESPTTYTRATGVGNLHTGKSANDMFWFLSLLAQKDHHLKTNPVRAQVAGITLQPERFVALGLYSPPSTSVPRYPQSDRIIFSRTSSTKKDKKAPTQTSQQVAVTTEHCPTTRKPRKRQKVGDMLSSFGTS